jgi:putative RecB family exonuclease
MNGNSITLEKLFRIFDADWYSQNVDTAIRFKKGEDKAGLRIMAKEMLAQYFHRPYNKVEGSEVAFALPLVNPGNGKRLGIDLEGFIDLIEEDDSIVEFKTSAQTARQSDIDSNYQLTIYSYAYEMFTQRSPRLIKLVNFVKTRKPKIVVYETKRTRADYQRLFGLASQILNSIRRQIFFPRMGFWCKDCEYAGQCKTWAIY